MSATAGDPPEALPAAPRPESGKTLGDLANGLPGCPFLRSPDGAWSSAYPSKDLRCWAVRPTAQPTVGKQGQLCVSAAHTSCATFEAAVGGDAPLSRDADGTDLWPDTSPVPVALEGVRARSGGFGTPRAGGQALLVGLMVVALVVLLVAHANPLAGPGPSPSAPASASLASAAAGASAAATPAPSPTNVVTPSPATPSPSASPSPTPTPRPTASPRTYKVRAGDTIAGIAAKYHTTVKAIVDANNIVDPRTIHPGQILIIP